LRLVVNALERDIFAECVACKRRSSFAVHQQDAKSDSIVWGCLSEWRRIIRVGADDQVLGDGQLIKGMLQYGMCPFLALPNEDVRSLDWNASRGPGDL